MSAPALHPTARVRPVLRERLERQFQAHCSTAVGLAVFAVWERMGPGQGTYPVAILCVLLTGSLLATPHDKQPAWDAAMPVDRARYALVLLVCSVAGSVFLLAVVIGLYVALFGDPEHPGWYPLALFAWGLTGHLLVSATLLSPMHRAAGQVVCFLVPVIPTAYVVLGTDGELAELRQMGVLEVLAWTALPLALAGAAAYTAVHLPARAPAPAGRADRHARAPRRDPAGALPNRPAPRAVRCSGPGRRSTMLTVFRRHFALQRRRAALPGVALLVFALVLLGSVAAALEAGASMTVSYFVESTELPSWCVWIALSWTVLVWTNEYGAQRRWNDTLPVGTGERRVLHAAAGAAWLLLFLAAVVAAPLAGAVVAGTLASPAGVPTWLWLGLPCRTLTLYLAATLVLFGARLSSQFVPSMLSYVVPDAVLNALPVDLRLPFATAAVSLVTGAALYGLVVLLGIDLLASLALGVDDGSDAASALRLALYAAAAAGAIALNDSIHHLGRLPTLGELRGFLLRAGELHPSSPATTSIP